MGIENILKGKRIDGLFLLFCHLGQKYEIKLNKKNIKGTRPYILKTQIAAVPPKMRLARHKLFRWSLAVLLELSAPAPLHGPQGWQGQGNQFYSPISAMGCLTPISLFTVITDTRLVSGWMAASSSYEWRSKEWIWCQENYISKNAENLKSRKGAFHYNPIWILK